jgi:transcriptional regulator of acetoin/glycerol metabolism
MLARPKVVEPRTLAETKAHCAGLARVIMIHWLMEVCSFADWNISEAARLAGVDRGNFNRLMRKHGIRRRDHLRGEGC